MAELKKEEYMENKVIDLKGASSYDVACAIVKVLLNMKGSAVKMFCVKDTSSVTRIPVAYRSSSIARSR